MVLGTEFLITSICNNFVTVFVFTRYTFRIIPSLLASCSWPFNKPAIDESPLTMKVNKPAFRFTRQPWKRSVCQ